MHFAQGNTTLQHDTGTPLLKAVIHSPNTTLGSYGKMASEARGSILAKRMTGTYVRLGKDTPLRCLPLLASNGTVGINKRLSSGSTWRLAGIMRMRGGFSLRWEGLCLPQIYTCSRKFREPEMKKPQF
jgi:hypothetical protein